MARTATRGIFGAKKLWTAGFAALLMLGILASCNAGGDAAGSSSDPVSGPGASEDAAKVEGLEVPTDFTSEEARQAMLAKSEDFPSKFDLRDVDGRSYVTPVRLQNPFGVCWGFSAITAVETNILGSVLADDPEAYKTLNLSEKQLAYFSHMAIEDESSSQYGEGMHVRDEFAADGVSAEDIYSGGTTFLASNMFAAGIGPVNESRDVSLEYHGANENIDTRTMPDGVEFDFSYSADDDWSIGEEYRYKQDYILKEAYILPSPARYTVLKDGKPSVAAVSDAEGDAPADAPDAAASSQDESSSFNGAWDIPGLPDSSEDLLASFGDIGVEYSYNEAATAAIKDQLLQKRAVSVSIHADASRPWEEDNEPKYINTDTWAHYTWESAMPNHAVTIVGWDDDYPAENFLPGHVPEGDGAWLVKNSWGSGENDFPDKGYGLWGIPVEMTDAEGNVELDAEGNPVMVGSGYFWLSYYDRSISNPETFVFDTVWNDPALGEINFLDDVHRYQYDLMPVLAVGAAKSTGVLKAANVFTAEADEYLICVSFETASPGTTVDYEVYLLSPDYESPTDGVLLSSGEQTYQYGGYYMEYLEPYAALREGQSYSIVVTQHLDTGEYVVDVPMGTGKNSELQEALSELSAPQYAVAVVNEGESFVYANGSWKDWSSESVRLDMLASDELTKTLLMSTDPQWDNFPLKGYATDSMVKGMLGFSSGEEELRLKLGEGPRELDLEFTGDATGILDMSDLSISWRLAPGGEELVEIEPGEDGSRAKVSAIAPGETFLFITDVSLGTTIIPVIVE